MKRLTYALAVVVFLLLSCGDTHTSSKTSSLTFEEFKAKLRQLAGSGPREMVTCESCKGTGKAMGFVSKEITCERCKGVGHLTDVCLRCRGVGSCHQGEMAICEKCKGTGRSVFKCVVCGGTGKLREKPCYNCKGTGERPGRCGACGGQGKIKKKTLCKACKGTGKRSIPCHQCKSTGKATRTSRELTLCDRCKGKGKYEFQHDPTVEQFTDALGEPEKVQQVAGQVTYYYTCKDGMIQMDVSFDGPRTDPETHIALDLNPNLY